MPTNVYIDGFNLYYGAVKGTPYKWLDFTALARALLRGHEIGVVKYFTARVQDRAGDLTQSQRQDLYLRALKTTGVEIYFGTFQTRTKRVLLVKKKGRKDRFADAVVTEEKGTDVSLGAHLLWDAFHKTMDTALVISNDADLQMPVDMAMQLGIDVIMVNPHRHSGQKSHLNGSDRRNLRRTHLSQSQLPQTVYDKRGRAIVRPKLWDP